MPVTAAADSTGYRHGWRWPAGPIAVVAHDAGGAEVLSSYVREQELDCRLALEGPARAIFQRKLGGYDNLTVDAALRASGSLLCGTSWQSDVELTAIGLARVLGKPSVAWLDHWVQYRERFMRSGTLCLPDQLWVSDTNALELARNLLPELPIVLMQNPYLADIRVELANATPAYPAIPGRLSILYVCEPVCEAALRQFGNAMHWGYTEQEALRYFLDNIDALGRSVGRIVLRPHPSESPDKYQGIIDEYALPLSIGGDHSLSAEIAASDCVVGCGSMAMVIALIAHKRVLSSIPPGGARCVLPHPGIESLQDLVRRR